MAYVEITTRGTEKLARLGAALKQAGDKDLDRELKQALRRAGKPLQRSAKQGALQILPYRGGLAERVARSRFTAAVRTTGRGANLRITGAGRDQLSHMDDGFVRHPVFGRWLPGQPPQKINPGWFTKPLTLDAPKQRTEIDKAIDVVAAQLEAKGG
jgi:hypothetical protein